MTQFNNSGNENPHLYDDWNAMATNLSYVFWALAALIALGYFVRLATTSGNKEKYDFINRHEIKFLWIATIVFVIGLCFYGNSKISEFSPVLFFVRGFVTIAFGLIVALIIQNLLKFYYPFYIEKRLKVLRYKPRVSPKTGKTMKLLSEDEEDAYLDEGMQAEENIFSVDYDVWKGEDDKDILIEKYSGHLHAIQCPECNYQTFKVTKEEITKTPTSDMEGEIVKHYLCGYCGYKAKKTVVLRQPSNQGQGSAVPA
jgi:hypothetical protein